MKTLITLKDGYEIYKAVAIDGGDLILLDESGKEIDRVQYILSAQAAASVGEKVFAWAGGLAVCGCYPANVYTSNPEYLGYWLMGAAAALQDPQPAF